MSIQDFIGLATKSLGVDEKTARSATGGLLGFLRQEASSEDFGALKRALPGSDGLLSGAPEKGAGVFGGIAEAAAIALGAKTGGALGVVGALGKSGLGPEQIGPFVSLFLGFLKQRGAADLVRRFARDIPELAKLAG